MPERAECRDVVIQNGALAALAARGEELEEVPAAVGAALPLVETWGQGRGTVGGTTEMQEWQEGGRDGV